MKPAKERTYVLASGTQVREEDFGLLFYTMVGPRLFFLPLGDLLESPFFEGEFTLEQWIGQQARLGSVPKGRILGLKKALKQLRDKGVILER